VGNLLDLSRIQAGALQPVLDWYEVDEVIDDVLPRLRRLVGDRPFNSSVQPDIPPVRLDFTRIEELLVNLVENAVKYTPPGSPIALRVRHDAGGLSMAVEDHGPGVPEGQRQRIFDSFYRGRRHTDRHPGSGLGLAICRGIAEAHGGTVSVETTPGGGATFVLHLPPSSVHQSSHQSVHQDVGGGTSPHAGENV
jgi:two-component system sensor histidine kinase KdpD